MLTHRQDKFHGIVKDVEADLDSYYSIMRVYEHTFWVSKTYSNSMDALKEILSNSLVYITALEQGFSSNDIINDIPVKIKNWQPQNYDKKHYGQVTLNEALTQSLNLATIDLSANLNLKDIIRTARKMGITTPLKNNPALVLGVDEVKVIDMAAAYLSIANGGYTAWPYAISEIYSKDGMQLYQHDSSEPLKILQENTINQITQMLENVVNY